jgi:opacity protein-like surface antigen
MVGQRPRPARVHWLVEQHDVLRHRRCGLGRYRIHRTLSNLPALNQANPSNTTTKNGWVVGAGAEWMATSNILVRAEYLYYGIDSDNSLAAVASPIAAPLPVAVNWGRENIQVFRVGGSYKF